tara:strand:+ start:34930 stop:35826 length:897 start_codon:yes stop_codon:yes gene_type:complete
MNLAILGQSNAARIESNEEALSEFGSDTVSFSAKGGSALLKSNASTPDNYWINETSQGKFIDGPLLVAAMGLLQSAAPDNIIWIQGEQDATRISGLEGRKLHKSALKYLFDRFLEYCDQVNIVTIGRRLQDKDKGFHNIRMALIDTAKEMQDVKVISHAYTLELEDVVHYSHDAQVLLCREIVTKLSFTDYDLGVKPIDTKTYTRAIDVTMDNSMVDNIGSKSHKLFSIRDVDGNLLQSPTSIAQLSALKVRLTFSSEPIKQYLCTCAGQLDGIESNSGLWVKNDNGEHLQPSMIRIK